MMHYIHHGKIRDQFRFHPVTHPRSFAIRAAIQRDPLIIPRDVPHHILGGHQLDVLNQNRILIGWKDGIDNSLLLYLIIKSSGMNHEYHFVSLTDVKYGEHFSAKVSLGEYGRISATISSHDQIATIVTTHDNISSDPVGYRVYPRLSVPCERNECIVDLSWN